MAINSINGNTLLTGGFFPPARAATLAGRTTLPPGDAGTASIQAAALQPGAAPLPFVAAQTADNLLLINDGNNPNTDITAGRVRDASDATNLHLAATMVKRLDQAWAAGGSSGNRIGAMGSGSSLTASKTYHVYLIGKLGQAITNRSRPSNVATLTVAGHGLGVGGTVRVQGVGAGYDAIAPITAVTTNTLSYASSGTNEGTVATPRNCGSWARPHRCGRSNRTLRIGVNGGGPPARAIRRSPVTPRPVEGSIPRCSMWSFVKEFWAFCRVRKKYWLLPIVLVMMIFGGVIVLTKGSVVAPFIYALF